MINLILAFITSFIITYLAIPSIIKLAVEKHLFDVPDSRKSHTTSVPTLGGLAIFAGLIFSLTFWSNQNQILELQYIISAIMILFFLGLKDDIINLVAYKKLIGQIVASIIIVHWGEVKLTTFYGLFNVHDLTIYPSYALSIFTIIVLTNSFNLIDGIDGLAGGIGVICATLFGTWFILVGSYQYAILAFALVGSLLAFLKYNVSPAKIFMGDTGSLILGLVISLLAIKFIEMNRVMEREESYKILSVPVVTIGILIIPLFDTLRVFTIRILNGRSPFKADRSHIHHILLDLGLSHVQSTFSLIAFNVSIILLVFSLKGLITGELLLFLVMFVPFAMASFLTSLKNKKSR